MTNNIRREAMQNNTDVAARRSKGKINIPIRIASVLVCLVLFSLHFNSGMYAKYSTGTVDKDKGRIAKFDVSAGKAGNSVTVLSFEPASGSGSFEAQTFKFRVENRSEVAVRYSVRIIFENEIPDYLTVTGAEKSEDKKSFILKDLGTLDAGNTSADVEIGFNIGAGYLGTVDGLHSEVSFDFTAVVDFVQID